MAGSGSKWGDKGGTPRLRGRKAVEQRKRRLALEPLCRDCKAKGRITPAQVVDHILPLAKGGPDTDDNCRALCQPCHLVRTREQFGHRQRWAISVDGWPEQD